MHDICEMYMLFSQARRSGFQPARLALPLLRSHGLRQDAHSAGGRPGNNSVGVCVQYAIDV